MTMKNTFLKIHIRAITVLGLFFLLACLLPLGTRPLIRPDEFRYAEIPREMLVSGDWTVPRLNGVRYFEKPALGYQLTAASFSVFGENAFALRLPCALAMLLTAAFLYFLMCRNSRDPLLPGLTSGIFLASGLVFGTGTFAVLDMQLTCALTLAIGGFYLALDSEDRIPCLLWLIFAGACAGAAFLIKGFLAVAVPAIVIAPFLIWMREWKKLLLYPWIPLTVMAAAALPWSIAIARAEPDFWHYFFFEEHISRFLSHTYDRKPEPFWYFLPFLAGGILPAGLLWTAAWRGIGRDWLKRPLIRFLLCWTVLPFLFFSASSCKLGTYILPCFPPLAALTAIPLRKAMLRGKAAGILDVLRRCWGWLWIAAAGLGTLGLILLPLVRGIPRPYPDSEVFPPLLMLCGFGYGALCLRLKPKHSVPGLGILLLGLAPVIFCGIHSIPASLFGNKMTETGLNECLKKIAVSPDDIVVTGRSEMAAAAWCLRRQDLIVLGKPGELAYGFSNYPEYASRHYPAEALPELTARTPPHRLVLVTLRDLGKQPLPEEWRGLEHADSNGVLVIRF